MNEFRPENGTNQRLNTHKSRI